jgi:hypothetical protein
MTSVRNVGNVDKSRATFRKAEGNRTVLELINVLPGLESLDLTDLSNRFSGITSPLFPRYGFYRVIAH